MVGLRSPASYEEGCASFWLAVSDGSKVVENSQIQSKQPKKAENKVVGMHSQAASKSLISAFKHAC